MAPGKPQREDEQEKTHAILLTSLSVVPLQLFAYNTALQRGWDIGKPRSLAKPVKVE